MSKLIILVLLVFCVGCASVETMDMPMTSPYPIISVSQPTGLKDVSIKSTIIRLKNVKEGKEVFQTPEYYPNMSKIKFTEDTVMVYILLDIKNPNKREYALWEVYNITNESEAFPFTIEHQKYGGELSQNTTQFILPMGEKILKCSYRVEIRDINRNVLMQTGHVSYER